MNELASRQVDSKAVVKEVTQMPWCGYWGTAVGGYWWILPLIGLVFMGVMFFVCIRGFGFGCMGGRRRVSGERSDLEREVEKLKEDVRKLVRQTN